MIACMKWMCYYFLSKGVKDAISSYDLITFILDIYENKVMKSASKKYLAKGVFTTYCSFFLLLPLEKGK